MRVQVKVGEPLWRATGRRRLDLEWPDEATVTVQRVIERLRADYPAFGPAFAGEGLAQAHPYRLFVDARSVEAGADAAGERIEPVLVDGQTLFIVLPAIGG